MSEMRKSVDMDPDIYRAEIIRQILVWGEQLSLMEKMAKNYDREMMRLEKILEELNGGDRT